MLVRRFVSRYLLRNLNQFLTVRAKTNECNCCDFQGFDL